MPAEADSESLLIRDIHTLVTMDARDTVLRGVWVLVRDGAIEKIGTSQPPHAGRVLNSRHLVALPGLVNTHHHL